MAQIISCEFCEISKNTFFNEHLRWLLLNAHVEDLKKRFYEKAYPDNLFKEQVVRALRGTPSNENSSKKVKGVLLEAVTEVFCKGVLRNFAKFTGKHLCQSLFFSNVADLRPFFNLLTFL